MGIKSHPNRGDAVPPLLGRAGRNGMATITVVFAVVLVGCGPSVDAEGRADLRVFDYRSTPFAIREVEGVSLPGRYLMREVEFAGPDSSPVTGRLHLPDGRDSDAGVVLLHGSGAHSAQMDDVAEPLACLGVIALAIDAPNAGRRNAFTFFTEQDYEEQVRLIRELRRSIDLLVEEYGADPDKLGFVGYSYGAAMGSLLVGVDPRVDAAALLAGDGGLVAHFTEDDGRPIEVIAKVSGIEEWLEMMAPIEPSLFVGDAQETSILMVSATRDRSVARDDSEAWHKAANGLAEIVWVDAGHGLNDEIRADAVLWLLEELNLPVDGDATCLG
jgi:poly(3-hydroxybutyrate) depolymerase